LFEAGYEPGHGPNYSRVQDYEEGVHAIYAERVGAAFGPAARDGELRRLDERWYAQGHFDFPLGETVEFLRLDQINSDRARLSLVLPGGGVKSLYQAGILDAL